jgi:AraC family transcriptional regulator
LSVNRVELTEGPVSGVRAELGPYEVQHIRFPAFYRKPSFEPDRGYLVIVLEGSMEKTFVRGGSSFVVGTVATMPGGSTHTTAFGRLETQVITIRSRAPDALDCLVRTHRQVQASASTMLGRRLAAELQAGDPSWPLAAEGLVLELIAATERGVRGSLDRRRGSWIHDVRDAVHDRVPQQPSLTELAEAVGVHPVHLSRCFRREFGVSIAEYARNARLEWAAGALASDRSLVEVALGAGFADQSHFTRAFRRHTGVTPGRYRRLLRG